ncbi:MAG: hypothetical protein KBB55_01900 [Candidatus Buchananbacteria bacterium]|nr:hypothetical protein [Candidatus Buchananbacteria bacterium]
MGKITLSGTNEAIKNALYKLPRAGRLSVTAQLDMTPQVDPPKNVVYIIATTNGLQVNLPVEPMLAHILDTLKAHADTKKSEPIRYVGAAAMLSEYTSRDLGHKFVQFRELAQLGGMSGWITVEYANGLKVEFSFMRNTIVFEWEELTLAGPATQLPDDFKWFKEYRLHGLTIS